MTTPLEQLISELEKLEREATPRPWNHEEERYSAKNVIGIKPIDDRWVAHCQPEFNGPGNADFIARSRNCLRTLLEIIREQNAALKAVAASDGSGESSLEERCASHAIATVNAMAEKVLLK